MIARAVRPPAAPIADEDDVLTITMRLASGRFESSISIPLLSSKESQQRFVESWLDLMAAGLKCTPKEAPHV